MSVIVVDESRCPQNHPCPVVRYCPTGAIKQRSWNSAPEIDKENCKNCGLCVRVCGYGAFTFAESGSRIG